MSAVRPGPLDSETERIVDALRRAVGRACPRDLADRREDLTQSALVKVLESYGREKSGPPPSSYLWQVAYSTIVDELRRLQRRKRMEAEAAAAPPEAHEPAPPRPDLSAAIVGCMQGLPSDRRAAVALHLHGFPAAEAARSLGWDLKRFNNLTYRGLENLRACLRSKGVDP